MVRPVITGLVLLMVCACTAAPRYQPAALTPRAPRPIVKTMPGQQPVWFASQADGRLLAVKMTRLDGGRIRVEETAQGEGNRCAGEFAGTTASRSQTMIVADDSTPACQLTFRRAGRRLVVAGEGPACEPVHGPGCTFEGTLTQR